MPSRLAYRRSCAAGRAIFQVDQPRIQKRRCIELVFSRLRRGSAHAVAIGQRSENPQPRRQRRSATAPGGSSAGAASPARSGFFRQAALDFAALFATGLRGAVVVFRCSGRRFRCRGVRFSLSLSWFCGHAGACLGWRWLRSRFRGGSGQRVGERRFPICKISANSPALPAPPTGDCAAAG